MFKRLRELTITSCQSMAHIAIYVNLSPIITLLYSRPVGAQVGHACLAVNWIGLSFNMANRQKFRDSALLVSAFLLLGINFNMITTAM